MNDTPVIGSINFNTGPRWYQDRDFPEIKRSNAEIIAIVPNEAERKALIEERNRIAARLHDSLLTLAETLKYLENLPSTEEIRWKIEKVLKDERGEEHGRQAFTF